MNEQEREQIDQWVRRAQRLAQAGLTHWCAGFLWGVMADVRRD